MGEGSLNRNGKLQNLNLGNDQIRERLYGPLKAAMYQETNPEVRRRIKAAIDTLIEKSRNERLTPEQIAELRKLDVLNFDVQRIREGVTGPTGEKEGLDIARLARAYTNTSMPAIPGSPPKFNNVGVMTAPGVPEKPGNDTLKELFGPVIRTLSTNPSQAQARAKVVTASRIANIAGPMAGAAAAAYVNPALVAPLAAAYGVSAVGQTSAGAKYLMGQNDWQKRMAEIIRNAAPYAAGAGQSVSQEQ
jgi:hypothetical protein